MKINKLIIFALLAIATSSYGQTTTNQSTTAQYGGIYTFGDTGAESETPNGTAYIYPENDTTALFYLYANKGAPSYNNGSIDGRIVIQNGKAVFRKHFPAYDPFFQGKDCVLAFEFGENALTIMEDETHCNCGFGNAVFVADTFLRTSAKIPQYYIDIYGDEIPFSKWREYIEPEPDAEEAAPRQTVITALNGTIELEASEGVDFPCIGLHFADRNLNRGFGTYIEIKKQGEFYVTNDWRRKEYATINEALENALKDEFLSFYEEEKQEKLGQKAWEAFVGEGGLQLFIDFANEIIDDEFLTSPFNETYG